MSLAATQAREDLEPERTHNESGQTPTNFQAGPLK
jgi:hypothetical protein